MSMLRPSINSIIKPGDNYYSFVVAVAKRAREIAQEQEEEHSLNEEKPVQKAVEDLPAARSKWATFLRFRNNGYRALSCTGLFCFDRPGDAAGRWEDSHV